MDSPSKESLSEDSSCLELARPHHRLKHTLPDQPRARALLMEKLKAKHASKAARSITRRKQHELRVRGPGMHSLTLRAPRPLASAFTALWSPYTISLALRGGPPP